MKLQILSGVLLLMFAAGASGAADTSTLPDGDAVAAKMMVEDAQRQNLIFGYHGMRRYVLENERMHKHAEILVRVDCNADGINQALRTGRFGGVEGRIQACREQDARNRSRRIAVGHQT